MTTTTLAAFPADVFDACEPNLHPADRQELEAWHDQRDAEERGDDHAFDLWLSGELAKLWATLRRLELTIEALGAF